MGWFDNLSPNVKIAIIIGVLILLPILGPPAFIALSLVIMIAFMFLWGGIPIVIGLIIILLIIFVGAPLIVNFIRVNTKHYKEYDPDKLF